MEYARVTRDIAQPADDVWDEIKAFGGIAAWVAGVTDCVLEGPETIGVVRRVQIGERQAREQLIANDDQRRQLSYAVLAPHSLPAANVRSTITVAPVGAASARVVWFSEAEMDAPNPALTDRIEGFFAASLARLDQICTARAV